MSVTGTRVFGHPQVVEYQAYVTRESSHFLRRAPSAFRLEHAEGETAKPSNVFRTIAGPDATAVWCVSRSPGVARGGGGGVVGGVCLSLAVCAFGVGLLLLLLFVLCFFI